MFDSVTQVKVATISLWNLGALFVNIVAFVIIYIKASKSASLKAFFVVQSSMMIWLLGKVLKTVSPNEDLRWFFIVFYYFGIILLEVSFLDFAYLYNKGKKMRPLFRRMIYLIGTAQFILVATNPYHYMFYSRYGFWGDDFGQLFYVHVVINYLFLIIGMVLCSIKFSKQLKDKLPIERHMIGMAILVPVILNFVYITRMLEELFDYLNIQVFDITPIVYTFSLLVFMYATFKYEFFDLSPIMKHEVTQKIDYPVVILNKKFKIIYSNDIYNTIFNEPYAVLESLDLKQEGNQDNVLNIGEQAYSYTVTNHKGIDGLKYIIGFTDVTSYELTKKALAEEQIELSQANQKLENQIDMLKESSHAGARNYIARELHDILGHSLVVTTKLLEVSKMYYKRNKTLAIESLSNAQDAIVSGYHEMKHIKSKDNSQVYNTNALEKEMKSMLKVVQISGVEVKYFQRGINKVIDEKVYDTLKKVVTELVTNTLKHGKSNKLMVSVMVETDLISVQTMDNGVGAKHLIKGNGLNGIDGRLSLVKGHVKYVTEMNEGFSAHIEVPI